MKIAVAATGEHLDSGASPVFGRCPYFILADVNDEIQEVKVLNNPAMTAGGGAGIQAAQLLAEEKTKVVISGAVGPNAFEVLRRFNIKVYEIQPGTVEENLKLYKKGVLEEITVPGPENRGRDGAGMGAGMGAGRGGGRGGRGGGRRF